MESRAAEKEAQSDLERDLRIVYMEGLHSLRFRDPFSAESALN